ncbi:MAG: hypothetical protein PHR56_00405 [Dehalococcoidales bacterium]|nr:hypothetical protein [Dehalococcoidales bacterium]
MKLGRTSWALLIGGVLLIIFASLGFAGMRQMRQQEKLATELEVAEQRVAKLQLEQMTTQQEELRAKLEKMNAELAAAQGKLHQANESIDVTDFIFDLAGSCSVTIEDLTSSGLRDEDLSKVKCSTQGLSLTATGDVTNLIKFIARLNTDFSTGLVESTDIVIPAESEEGVPAAHIALSVYNYQGG